MEYASIEDFSRSFGFGRTTVYHLISTGTLRAIKVGGRVLVDCNAARAWLESLPQAPMNCARRAAAARDPMSIVA